VAKKIVAPKLSVDDAVTRLREMHERGDTEAMFGAMLELLTKLVFDNAKLSVDNARLLKRALGQTSERVGSAQLDMLLKLVDAPQEGGQEAREGQAEEASQSRTPRDARTSSSPRERCARRG
jgi:hypothetical protein